MDLWTKVEMLTRIVLANKGLKTLEPRRWYVVTRFMHPDEDTSYHTVVSSLSARTAYDVYDRHADDPMATRVVMFYGESMRHATDKVGWRFWDEYERGKGKVAPQLVEKLNKMYAEALA